jgi:hypothetical protein
VLLPCLQSPLSTSNVIPADPRESGAESRNPKISGCPLQPEADLSEALWRIREHDGREDAAS